MENQKLFPFIRGCFSFSAFLRALFAFHPEFLIKELIADKSPQSAKELFYKGLTRQCYFGAEYAAPALPVPLELILGDYKIKRASRLRHPQVVVAESAVPLH